MDAKLDVLPWHSMNGRCVRMAELAVDGALEELPQKLRSVCHIEDVAEYGRTLGKNYNPQNWAHIPCTTRIPIKVYEP